MTRPLKYLQFCRAKGLTRLLETLHRSGLRAGVLSDYPAGGKLQALGLEGRFTPILSATACEIWNLAPDEVLFVGDRADVDAAGAAAAGMPCVIIDPRESRSAAGGAYHALPSLEKLCDVIHAR